MLIAEAAQKDLDEAMPALNEALKSLDSLNKNAIAEVKAYGKPPTLVEIVMEAVMILRQSEPSWAEAKRQLGDPNFINSLKEFDKDNIPDKVLRKINKYTSEPDFTPEKVGTVSGAAKSFVKFCFNFSKSFLLLERNLNGKSRGICFRTTFL